MKKVLYLIASTYVEYEVGTGEELVWSGNIINSCLSKDMALEISKKEINKSIRHLKKTESDKNVEVDFNEEAKNDKIILENDPVDGTPYATVLLREHNIRKEFYIYIREAKFTE